MIQKKRYFILPEPIVNEQKENRLTSDLYLTEIGEVKISRGEIWNPAPELKDHLLIFCTKGNAIIQISNEQIAITDNQFIIIPKGFIFKLYSEITTDSDFLIAYFNGEKSLILGKDFSSVRGIIPSVNNRVANREMLFDEIFNNLSKGFHNENLEYINFCFGHLIATFIYACRTSEDIADESNQVVRRAVSFLEQNLDKKLTLHQVAKEAGYSPTYLTTMFKKEIGYSPLSYFSHLKILKACEFLDQTSMKVKEISFELGYTDPYYFTKDFTKKMGLSPRQYRNRVVARW